MVFLVLVYTHLLHPLIHVCILLFLDHLGSLIPLMHFLLLLEHRLLGIHTHLITLLLPSLLILVILDRLPGLTYLRILLYTVLLLCLLTIYVLLSVALDHLLHLLLGLLHPSVLLLLSCSLHNLHVLDSLREHSVSYLSHTLHALYLLLFLFLFLLVLYLFHHILLLLLFPLLTIPLLLLLLMLSYRDLRVLLFLCLHVVLFFHTFLLTLLFLLKYTNILTKISCFSLLQFSLEYSLALLHNGQMSLNKLLYPVF
ncbi:hypothetical protein WY13_02527 [Clostridium ljungdahlii]|uniref:Uncharacterized protein n=1 Tax=Clostridium ljungdahlii TaxID=1538 RepID=A0A162L7N1_9CLOT|nr:hypothetical protein WY13_02527 [Clostridium ljungdahlii]